jgi:hypothetical protein
MKKTLAAVAVTLLTIGGYFGFAKYQRQQFIQALGSHVKTASLRVANSARYESDDGSQISFAELFSRLQADIQEVDGLLIETQSISTPKTATVTDPTVVYLQSCQEYLRALLQKSRKMLTLREAIDRSRKALRQADEYAHPTRESDTEIVASAHEVDEAERGYASAVRDLVTTAGRLRESRKSIATVFADDALIPLIQLDRVIEKNSQKSNAAIGQPTNEKGK